MYNIKLKLNLKLKNGLINEIKNRFMKSFKNRKIIK